MACPQQRLPQIKWARHPEKCLDVDKGVGRETQDFSENNNNNNLHT